MRKFLLAFAAGLLLLWTGGGNPAQAESPESYVQDWVQPMNQTGYWSPWQCTKYDGHGGWIPAQYDAAVIKAGQMVRVYPNLEQVGGFQAQSADGKDISWVMKCTKPEPPPTTEPPPPPTTEPPPPVTTQPPPPVTTQPPPPVTTQPPPPVTTEPPPPVTTEPPPPTSTEPPVITTVPTSTEPPVITTAPTPPPPPPSEQPPVNELPATGNGSMFIAMMAAGLLAAGSGILAARRKL